MKHKLLSLREVYENMRRYLVPLMLAAMALSIIGISCGGGPKPEPEQPPPPPPDTTSMVKKDTTPPPPPPPPPMLKESQFKTIYFDFDKYNLRPDARTGLDHNFELLREFPDVIVQIEGHCDERGTIEYNLALGEKRARSAMEYLVGLGIKGSRISIISYGKERPIDPGHTEAAWAKNRRCEFKIVSQ